MELSRYELIFDEDISRFIFTSVGIKGEIKKAIDFYEAGPNGYYNLSFGDVNEETGELNDTIITNNGDCNTVLATVTAAVYAYSEKYPLRWIYAIGRNRARTRLYQMGISKYLDQARKDFEVFGFINGQWQLFEKGINYESFLARRKTHKYGKDYRFKENK
jgi:hypothetical protein